MKKIITTIILFVSIINFSQEIIIPLEEGGSYLLTKEEDKTYYFSDVNNILDRFVGTWVFDDGIEYFKVEFYVDRFDGVFDSRDFLHSKILYVKNGNVIYDTYNVTDILDDVSLGFGFVYDINKYDMSYSEPYNSDLYSGRQKKANLLIEHIIDSEEKLVWTRTNEPAETIRWPDFFGKYNYTGYFQIPENMILIKQ